MDNECCLNRGMVAEEMKHRQITDLNVMKDDINLLLTGLGGCKMPGGRRITSSDAFIREYNDGGLQDKCCFDTCEMPKDERFPCLTSRMRYMDDIEELENLKMEEPEFCEDLKQDFNRHLLNITAEI